MLIHQCVDCETLSINRIASDDDAATLMTVFNTSIENHIHSLCDRHGILALQANDHDVLNRQLYGGRNVSAPAW
jgi:hypothetical protein